MEDDDKIEPEYLKGFNEGYTLSQHTPELAEKIASIDSDFIRLVGFKDGRKQYQMEQIKDRLPTWLKSNHAAKAQSGLTKSKGRDVEPDK